MAITAVNIFSGHALSVSQLTTGSLTPGTSKLGIISAYSFKSGGGGTTPTVSGAGVTWVQIWTQINAANDERITFFRSLNGSPGTGVITVDWGGQSQDAAFMNYDEFSGVDTSGTNGSGAIVQSVSSNVASGTSTGYTITLAALGSSSNAGYGVVKNSTTATITAGSGFTELMNNTAVASSEAEWAVNKTAVAWTWSSQTVATYGIAIEIKAAAAGAAPFLGFSLPTPYDAKSYRDPDGFEPNAFLPNTVSVGNTSEYGSSLNISAFSALSYRDYSLPQVNLSLYAPAVIAPFLGLSLPVPFDTKGYRDTTSWESPNAFLPTIIQPPVQSLLWPGFNSLSYRDSFPASAAFLPNIIQTPAGTFLNLVGNVSKYDTKAYRDASSGYANAFLPFTIQGPVQSLLGAPFSGLNYRDLANCDVSPNAFLPQTIQGPVQSLLGAPFSGLPYRDSNNYDNAFLPATIQGPVQSVLGVSFNGLNYRDYSAGPGNPNLFPVVSVSPFFNPLAAVPFNSGSYKDAGNYDNAFLPSTIQGQVQSLLAAPFNSLSYRDLFSDSNAFLPNIIQGSVQSLLGVPFNSVSYRDSFEFSANPNLAQVVVAPFFGLSTPLSFDTKSYRDTSNTATNAFLPQIIQSPVQSLLGAPFNALVFRDLANIGANAFLPNIIQTPVETLLNFIENAAPFSSGAYRDSRIFQISLGLYPPPPAGPFPFYNPFPIIRFDLKAYADNTAFLKNAFLPASIQNQVQSLLGAPFNALAFRDLANTAINAFLPQTIQPAVQSLLGVQFSGLGYRDSFVVLRNPSFYTPVAANPFTLPVLQAWFNSLSYRDSANASANAFLPNVIQGQIRSLLGAPFSAGRYLDTSEYPPNAFLPAVVQSPVQSLLGAPFTGISYRDASNAGANAFLPSIIQGRVQSLPGAPFAPISYRDSFIVPVNLGLLHPPVSGTPFFLSLPATLFNSLTYRDLGNYNNAFLPVRFIPGEVIRIQGSVSQVILLRGSATQISVLGGGASPIVLLEGKATQIESLGGSVGQIEEPD